MVKMLTNLSTNSFGYHDVFPQVGHPHVGQNVKVRAPDGRDVYPIVTGTFGGADFIHLLMGEATDHLSQVSPFSSLNDSSREIRRQFPIYRRPWRMHGPFKKANPIRQTLLRSMFFDLPAGDGSDLTRDMDSIQGMRAGQPGPQYYVSIRIGCHSLADFQFP